MGKDSMSKYGRFDVSLPKPVFAPGEQVNGVIYLDLLMDFPSSHITLKLEGKEKIKYWVSRQQYDYTDQNGQQHYRTVYESRSDSHKCFKYEFPCASFNGEFVPAGQYQIPFSFSLPEDIPSTFYYKWHNMGDCYAKIHYSAKVKLESNGNDKDLLKDQFDIVINSAQIQKTNHQRVDLNKEIVSCCCIKKGKFKMTSYFEKSAYMPGETAYLVVEAENNSSAQCISISGNFTQSLKIKGGAGETKHLTSVKAPGLAPGEKYVGQDAKRLEIPLSGTRIKGGDDVGTSNTSVNGKLIQCNYYVSAQTEMDACICCDEHPVSEIYINLYNAVPPVSRKFKPPQSWAPQIMDPYVANFLPEFNIEVKEG